MLGLARTPASSAALLLNVEGLATMSIAWLVFTGSPSTGDCSPARLRSSRALRSCPGGAARPASAWARAIVGAFSIITKSALITRDLDLLGPMAERGLVSAFVSVTTLDRKLARAMEPRAATPERRLEAVAKLAQAGVPTGVGFARAIAGLNDHEMEAVLERAAAAGATSAMYVALRLPLEIKDLFREWLQDARSDRAARVMSLVRQMRGGKDYAAEWGTRMKGQGPIAELLRARFATACRRLGLNERRIELDETRFQGPAEARRPAGAVLRPRASRPHSRPKGAMKD